MDKANKKTVLLLITLIGAVSVVLLRQYLFGNRVFVFDDIGSDTMQLYLSQYGSIVRHLREGDLSFWDFENGFGTSLFLYNMTNPMLIPVYLAGALFGTERIPYLMVYVFLLELILSGIAAYLFLSMFRFSERAKLPASLMYAFNGFLMVWGQHYQFSVLCVLLPLELLVVERYLRDRRTWKALTLMTALVVFNSMYAAYMILLFAGLYVLVRRLWNRPDGVRSYGKDVVRSALVMLLGVGLSGISLLPSALAIMKVSNRIGGSEESLLARLLHPYSRDYYVTLLGRTISTTSRGINVYDGYKNYYEGPCLFFTTLFLFLITQYLCLLPKRKMARRQKVLHLLVLAGAASGMLFAYFGVMMNGFVGEFTRFFFLYMIYFAYLSAWTLEEMIIRKRFSIFGFLVSAIYLLRFSNTYYFAALSNPKRTILILLCSGLLMGVLLTALSKSRIRRAETGLYVLLLAALLVNIYADGWKNVDANSMTQIRYSRLALEKNGDYFKTMYDRDTLEALSYLKETDPGCYRIEKLYGATISMDAPIQGYASVSTYNSTMNGNLSRYVEQYWSELLYHDGNHLTFGGGSAYQNTEQAGFCGIRYLLAHAEDPEVPGYEEVRRFGTVRVLKNRQVEGISSYYTEAAIDGHTAKVSYEARDRESVISSRYPKPDGHLEVSVNAAADGLLVTTIPYENGWNVLVDGTLAEQLLVNEGFIGIRLSQGTHQVTYRYRAPGLLTGGGLSIASLCLLLLIDLMKRRRGREVSDYTV